MGRDIIPDISDNLNVTRNLLYIYGTGSLSMITWMMVFDVKICINTCVYMLSMKTPPPQVQIIPSIHPAALWPPFLNLDLQINHASSPPHSDTTQ